jgi:hypothetical protein
MGSLCSVSKREIVTAPLSPLPIPVLKSRGSAICVAALRQNADLSQRETEAAQIGTSRTLAGVATLEYLRRMKIALEIPAPVAKRFKAAVPSGERSAVVTRLLERALVKNSERDEAVCRRVNRIKQLSSEMAEWERFDDTDPA